MEIALLAAPAAAASPDQAVHAVQKALLDKGLDPGPGYGQDRGQDSGTLLEQSTAQLIREFRLSNRSMRIVRNPELVRVDGDRALSTMLSNASPIGGRETNWLVTLEHPEGLLFFVFTAPDRDFQSYENAFRQMLYSVRIKR